MTSGTESGASGNAITVENLTSALDLAGRKVGIGSPYPERRARHGWFRVELVEIVKTDEKEQAA
jgi:hypothetical protein